MRIETKSWGVFFYHAPKYWPLQLHLQKELLFCKNDRMLLGLAVKTTMLHKASWVLIRRSPIFLLCSGGSPIHMQCNVQYCLLGSVFSLVCYVASPVLQRPTAHRQALDRYIWMSNLLWALSRSKCRDGQNDHRDKFNRLLESKHSNNSQACFVKSPRWGKIERTYWAKHEDSNGWLKDERPQREPGIQ